MHKLNTIVQELNLNYIDILKMDIEGAEYAVIEELSIMDIDIGQILIELHHRLKGNTYSQTKRVLKILKNKGYKLFYVSQTGDEFSFIHRSKI